MTINTCLLHLAALRVFFATPPDTGQLPIIANSARHGLKKSGWTIAGDLTAS
jgi:threonine/homoserine/homoserine lactone efflux protein